MSAIDPLSAGGQRQVAGAASGEKPFGFLPALEVDDGDVAAQAIGDIERRVAAVRDDSAGLLSGGQRLHDVQCCRVND